MRSEPMRPTETPVCKETRQKRLARPMNILQQPQAPTRNTSARPQSVALADTRCPETRRQVTTISLGRPRACEWAVAALRNVHCHRPTETNQRLLISNIALATGKDTREPSAWPAMATSFVLLVPGNLMRRYDKLAIEMPGRMADDGHCHCQTHEKWQRRDGQRSPYEETPQGKRQWVAQESPD